ncbi:MAG: sigma-70 family RNA polymerase sigma factor [Gemmatimonadota bacterium]
MSVLPIRSLSLELDLAVRGFLVHPEPESVDRFLAARCAMGSEEVRRGFARGGLPAPEVVCMLGILFRATQKEKSLVGGGERWLRAVGIGYGHLQQRCRWLAAEPEQFVRSGEPHLVLQEFRRFVRRPPDHENPNDDSAQSRRAFGRLYRKHGEAMMRSARSLGLSLDESWDLCHEVFTRVLEKKNDDVGRGYLLRSVRNAISNRFRDRAARAEACAPHGAAFLRETDPGPEAVSKVRAERVVRSIEALPEPGRTVLRLCCVLGWSAPTVAPLLGRTEKAVALVRDRTRQQLAAGMRRPVRATNGTMT